MTSPIEHTPHLPGPADKHVATTGQRADIQGLRAVAVILVVAFHAGVPLTGGFVGVDVFFVISGFVIAATLLRQLDATGTLNFASFYTRRMRRLLPALALLTVVVALTSVFLLGPFGPQQSAVKTGLAASFFSANIQLSRVGGGYFDIAMETNPLLHTWSLSVEEQFYFGFPLCLLLVWRFGAGRVGGRSPRATTAWFLLIAIALSLALCCYTTYHLEGRFGRAFAFYSPVTRAWEFGVGVLVALGSPALARMNRRLAVALGVVGLALVGLAAVAFNGTTAFPGFASLLPVVGTAGIIAAGSGGNWGVSRLLATRPAVWIGDLSYGWYLWHWPPIVFAAAFWPGRTWILTVAAVGALLPTWLSYRFVENPIRFNERLKGRRIVFLVAACITIPVVACAGLLLANRLEQRTASVKSYAATVRFHTEGTRGCEKTDPVGKRAASDCTWPVAHPRGTIFLLGDSNAQHFAEPAAAAANQVGYDLTLATMPGCSFADVVRESVPEFGFDGLKCHRFITESLAGLTAAPPALVILASSSSQVIENPGPLHDPRTGAVATTPEAKATLWGDGLTRVLRQLNAAGIPTVVIHPVPHFGNFAQEWEAAGCPAVRIFSQSCGTSIGRPQVERQQQLARNAEERAVAGAPGSTAVDFTNDLCLPETCLTERSGLWLYRDAVHLSVDGALSLTARFRQMIVDRSRQP